MKILHIEDTHLDYMLMSHWFSNYLEFPDITWAINGFEAMNLLKERDDFDVILLDLNMPVMDGHEFLKWYDTFFITHKPVFVTSSSTRDEDVESCRKYGYVKKFLNKPFGETEIDMILTEMGMESAKKSEAKAGVKEGYNFLNSLFKFKDNIFGQLLSKRG